MAAAFGDQISVAGLVADVGIGDTQKVSHDLQKAGLVALADGLGSGGEGDGAVILKAEFDVFLRRAKGSLNVITDAKAAAQTCGL